MNFFRKFTNYWLLFSGLFFSGPSLLADNVDEGAVKTALAYNFARFITWPENDTINEIKFCVFDNDLLLKNFLSLGGRSIDGRIVSVSHVDLKDDLRSCQVLFIDSRDRQQVSLAIAKVADWPVLTVGQLPDFIDLGGVINLYRENGKIRFAIGLKSAERSRLQVSSRLLQVAKVIED